MGEKLGSSKEKFVAYSLRILADEKQKASVIAK